MKLKIKAVAASALLALGMVGLATVPAHAADSFKIESYEGLGNLLQVDPAHGSVAVFGDNVFQGETAEFQFYPVSGGNYELRPNSVALCLTENTGDGDVYAEGCSDVGDQVWTDVSCGGGNYQLELPEEGTWLYDPDAGLTGSLTTAKMTKTHKACGDNNETFKQF